VKKMNLGFDPRYIGLASPVDTASTTVNSDVIGCKELTAIDFLVYFGTITGDTVVVTVEECDDVTPSNSTAIAFKYRKGAAVGTDTDGAVADATTAGVTIAATDDDKVLTISVDPAALTAGYPYLRVVADPGASATAVEIAIVAVAWPRYASATNLSLVD
jgi:hypothetical protein